MELTNDGMDDGMGSCEGRDEMSRTTAIYTDGRSVYMTNMSRGSLVRVQLPPYSYISHIHLGFGDGGWDGRAEWLGSRMILMPLAEVFWAWY